MTTDLEPALSRQLEDRMRELGRIEAATLTGINRKLGLGISNTKLRRVLRRAEGVVVGRPRPHDSEFKHFVVTYRA